MSAAARAMAPRRRWVVLVAAVVGVALMCRLGVWQLSRAAQKESLQALLEGRAARTALATADLAATEAGAQAQHYRRIHLRGRWLADRTVFLENRQMDGLTGFFVVTPLLLEGAGGGPRDAVLVQRGFTPRDIRDRTLLPEVPTPAGSVEIDGAIAPPPSRLYEFTAASSGRIRQNLHLDEFARETGLALRPLSVQQADGPAATADGLRRHWARPAVDVQKHYGYAFQWFALAALMAGLYVWFQLLRPRLRRGV